MNTIPTDKPILFFDGLCNLCNGYVQFVIERDPNSKFRFASLQSNAGQSLLRENKMPTQDLKTVLLYKNGKIYSHSDVALEISKDLGAAWPLLTVFKIVPRFMRDGVYNFIATNRYKWFGKKESCWLPTPDLKARFLD